MQLPSDNKVTRATDDSVMVRRDYMRRCLEAIWKPFGEDDLAEWFADGF
jgi:hypothetical protein